MRRGRRKEFWKYFVWVFSLRPDGTKCDWILTPMPIFQHFLAERHRYNTGPLILFPTEAQTILSCWRECLEKEVAFSLAYNRGDIYVKIFEDDGKDQ